MKSCEKCRFYQTPRGVQVFGRCRHNPPSMSGEWPSVATDDWCGEWDAPQPVETGDRRTSGVKADPLAYWNGASLDGNAIRVTQFPSGLVIQGANTASPLDQPHKSTYDAGKRYAELVANGTEPAEAAHQVDVEFGFNDRTAMADSRDSAEMPGV